MTSPAHARAKPASRTAMITQVTKVPQQRLGVAHPVTKATETGAQARSHQSTTTGERFGVSRQGKRDSGVEPEEFVEGDGLENR